MSDFYAFFGGLIKELMFPSVEGKEITIIARNEKDSKIEKNSPKKEESDEKTNP